MTPVIGYVIYAVMALIIGRRVSRFMLADAPKGQAPYDEVDRWFAALAGLATGLIWPISLLAVLFLPAREK